MENKPKYKQLWRERQLKVGKLEVYKKQLSVDGQLYELPEIEAVNYLAIAPITKQSELLAVKRFSMVHEREFIDLVRLPLDDLTFAKGKKIVLLQVALKETFGLSARKFELAAVNYTGLHENNLEQVFIARQLTEEPLHEIPEDVIEIVKIKDFGKCLCDEGYSTSVKSLARVIS